MPTVKKGNWLNEWLNLCFENIWVNGHFVSLLCCACLRVVFVMLLAFPVLPISLGFSFLIAPSVFSYVYILVIDWFGLVSWCLTPLSIIFQLYRGGHFNWWRKPEDPEKTTDLPQVTDKLFHIILYISPWARFELATSVMIGIYCIGSRKSNYHTITAMMVPLLVIEMTMFSNQTNIYF